MPNVPNAPPAPLDLNSVEFRSKFQAQMEAIVRNIGLGMPYDFKEDKWKLMDSNGELESRPTRIGYGVTLRLEGKIQDGQNIPANENRVYKIHYGQQQLLQSDVKGACTQEQDEQNPVLELCNGAPTEDEKQRRFIQFRWIFIPTSQHIAERGDQ